MGPGNHYTSEHYTSQSHKKWWGKGKKHLNENGTNLGQRLHENQQKREQDVGTCLLGCIGFKSSSTVVAGPIVKGGWEGRGL